MLHKRDSKSKAETVIESSVAYYKTKGRRKLAAFLLQSNSVVTNQLSYG